MARKRALSSFGRQIKVTLMDVGQNQNWLIDEVKKLTPKYLDSSNLYKIMTGQIKSPEIEAAISKVLNIEVKESA